MKAHPRSEQLEEEQDEQSELEKQLTPHVRHCPKPLCQGLLTTSQDPFQVSKGHKHVLLAKSMAMIE